MALFTNLMKIIHKNPLVPQIGTSGLYFRVRNKENKNHKAMKNTEYNIDYLASMISSESSFNALLEMMGDMGLELDSASLLS